MFPRLKVWQEILRSPGEGGAEETEGEVPTSPEIQTEVEGEVEAQVSPETPPEAPAPEGKKHWSERRIDALTAKNYELARALEAEKAARLALAPKSEGSEEETPTPTKIPPTPRMYTAEEARNMALAEAQALEFNRRCNQAASDGKKEFKDFGSVVDTLNAKLGGMTTSFVEAALETGLAPQVIYHLGKDLDKAAEILAMSPVQQAVAISKFATELSLKKPPGVSKAPPPVTPKVGGSGGGDGTLRDELPMDQWMRMREAQVSGKR